MGFFLRLSIVLSTYHVQAKAQRLTRIFVTFDTPEGTAEHLSQFRMSMTSFAVT